MSTTSVQLKLTLQDLDDNPDTWGDILNVSTIELLEDSVAGMSQVQLLNAADYTMDTTAGGDTVGNGHYRKMIVDIFDNPGGATNIIVPNLTGLYLAVDNTTGGYVITLKTSAGAGVALISGQATWCYCDGVDVLACQVQEALTAATATLATDSTNLGGVVNTEYAQKAVAQTFTKGQVTARTALLSTGGGPWFLDVDTADSNSFYHLTTAAFTLKAPTNQADGQQFSLVIEQGVGAPHGITFLGSTFIWQGGTVPTLSTTLGDIDYLAFEFVETLSAIGAGRWVGSIIKAVS